MTKLINLAQAEKIAGKTPRTLKRWIDSGFITDKRNKGDKYSPIVISETELRKYLSTLSPTARNAKPLPEVLAKEKAESEISAWKQLLSEVKADRERLVAQVSRLESELVGVKHELANIRLSKDVLEKELLVLARSRTGVIRRLLQGAVSKWRK